MKKNDNDINKYKWNATKAVCKVKLSTLKAYIIESESAKYFCKETDI